MNGKMMAGIGLAVGIVVIAFLAAPIQAYVNGNQNGDVLQTQTQERLKTQDCDCNCDMLRMQEQKRLGTQHCDYSWDCIQTQNRNRQRAGEYVTNGTCVQTMNMRQFRNQHREVTRSQGG